MKKPTTNPLWDAFQTTPTGQVPCEEPFISAPLPSLVKLALVLPVWLAVLIAFLPFVSIGLIGLQQTRQKRQSAELAMEQESLKEAVHRRLALEEERKNNEVASENERLKKELAFAKKREEERTKIVADKPAPSTEDPVKNNPLEALSNIQKLFPWPEKSASLESKSGLLFNKMAEAADGQGNQKGVEMFVIAHHAKASANDVTGFVSDYASHVVMNGITQARDAILEEESKYHRDYPLVAERVILPIKIDANANGVARVHYFIEFATSDSKGARRTGSSEISSEIDLTSSSAPKIRAQSMKVTLKKINGNAPSLPAKSKVYRPAVEKSDRSLQERTKHLDGL